MTQEEYIKALEERIEQLFEIIKKGTSETSTEKCECRHNGSTYSDTYCNECGKGNCKQCTSTPDTEWEKESARMAIEASKLTKHYARFSECIYQGIKSIVSSRDTYWKEQLQKAREETRNKILSFTNKRADEQYYRADGIAILMRNKGYNDGMRAVEEFIHSELDQDITN